MYDLNSAQRDCLRVIAKLDNPNGLEIRDELEEYYGSDVSHSRLYPNLDKLSEKGLINKSDVDGRTNSYKLTPRGRREVGFQFAEWQRAIEKMDSIQLAVQ